MQKTLILGGSGLVGTAIINEMNSIKDFRHYATYYENPIPLGNGKSFRLNIGDLDGLCHILNTLRPQNIVSCLRGDYDKQLNLHIKISEYLKAEGGSLYFFSTTNVFDNDLSKPHYESDSPNSHTDYGQFKIECEKRIVDILQENACILRLPQVWGKNSPRMQELMESLRFNKSIVVYPKLFHNTNTDIMIAKQLCYIIQNNLKGIFHLASEEVVNYKGFYDELIAGLGFDDARIEDNFEEEGYFAILSKRGSEFPVHLRFTTKSVISYLTHR